MNNDHKEFIFQHQSSARKEWPASIVVLSLPCLVFLLLPGNLKWFMSQTWVLCIIAVYVTWIVLMLILDYQWGSRINFNTKELIWWKGLPPLKEIKISIPDIRCISIDPFGSDVSMPSLTLLDKDQRRILFYQGCVRRNLAYWAESMQKEFPHIKIENLRKLQPADPKAKNRVQYSMLAVILVIVIAAISIYLNK